MKKYWLISYCYWHTTGTYIVHYGNEVIDVPPFEWLLKWKQINSEADEVRGYYEFCLLFAGEISEEEYLLYKQYNTQ